MRTYLIRTLNSLYRIEEDANGSGTWTRVGTTEDSGQIRSTSGVFTYHTEISLGLSASFLGPPFDKSKNGEGYARFLTTSRVTQIIPEEEEIGEKHE